MDAKRIAELKSHEWSSDVREYITQIETRLASALAEIDRLHSLPDDLRTCGELSCEDCNARTEGLRRENEQLRTRLLTAAGDDLCRLTQEEIKAYTSGAVQIPPEDEFISSCVRFHKQIAGTAGVLANCLTSAQMAAKITSLEQQATADQELIALIAEYFKPKFDVSDSGGVPRWRKIAAMLTERGFQVGHYDAAVSAAKEVNQGKG